MFREVAYKARHRQDILAGIDEFLDQVTALPPGEWDPKIRIEPPQSVPSQVIYFSFWFFLDPFAFSSTNIINSFNARIFAVDAQGGKKNHHYEKFPVHDFKSN